MYPFCLSMTFTRVPAAIDNAIGDYALTTQAGWTAFGKSLNSGNIAAAQTALGDYTQSLTASNFSMSTPTRPSDQFTSDLKQMGDALSSGDLSTAQSIFATAQRSQPESVVMAMGEAVDAAALDGASTANWMQDLVNFASTLSPARPYTPTSSTDSSSTSNASAEGALAGDLATMQSVVHEGDSNIGAFLITQGYSSTAVNSIVDVLDYNNSTGLLGAITGDIADALKNADTFAVNSSIGNIGTSGDNASVVVNSSSESFQGDSPIGSSSVTEAQAEGSISSTSANASEASEAFFYSFSIAETKSDGTSIEAGTSNSAYLSGDSIAKTPSSVASAANEELTLKLVEALTRETTAQTASVVREIASNPIDPLASGANPATSPYYSMMTERADDSMSQVESALADLLGASATTTATATSSMSGYDGNNEAYSSVTVYA